MDIEYKHINIFEKNKTDQLTKENLRICTNCDHKWYMTSDMKWFFDESKLGDNGLCISCAKYTKDKNNEEYDNELIELIRSSEIGNMINIAEYKEISKEFDDYEYNKKQIQTKKQNTKNKDSEKDQLSFF